MDLTSLLNVAEQDALARTDDIARRTSHLERCPESPRRTALAKMLRDDLARQRLRLARVRRARLLNDIRRRARRIRGRA